MALSRPIWLDRLVSDAGAVSIPEREAARLALDIAIASAQAGCGPFGALILDNRGVLKDVGWNAVVSSHDSTAHAEITALRRAQSTAGTHDLEPFGYTMFCSAAPCIQCFGAIYWSGIKKIFYVARQETTERFGFDEGPVSDELWKLATVRKGIVLSQADPGEGIEGDKPFKLYFERGGKLY